MTTTPYEFYKLFLMKQNLSNRQLEGATIGDANQVITYYTNKVSVAGASYVEGKYLITYSICKSESDIRSAAYYDVYDINHAEFPVNAKFNILNAVADDEKRIEQIDVSFRSILGSNSSYDVFFQDVANISFTEIVAGRGADKVLVIFLHGY